MNPLVSIVIPTFNHAEFLNKALDSVVSQSYEHWEAIVIDNHSTDKTSEIVNNYKDSRIKYFKINNYGIIAKSRNLGIKVSRGEWIAFLDSDDWWSKDKLKHCAKNFNDKVDLIYHKLQIIYDVKKFKLKIKKSVGRKLNQPILKNLLISVINDGSAIGNSSVVVRKDILDKIGGIDENKKLVASEDFNTWLRVAKETNQFKFLEQTLGFYFVHAKSSQKRNLSIPHRQCLVEFASLLSEKQKLNFEVKLKYMSGNYNISNSNYAEAKKDFIFVIRHGEINLKIRSLIKIIFIIFRLNEKI